MNKSKRTPKDGPNVAGGSREARRTAAAALQVLAGAIHPSEAAQQLGINLPRYYILEKRALEGMVLACESRSKGPGTSPEKEREELLRQVKRLENDVLRYQALARTSQRSVGLKEIKPKKGRRKPAVRALKVIKTLQEVSDGNSA